MPSFKPSGEFVLNPLCWEVARTTGARTTTRICFWPMGRRSRGNPDKNPTLTIIALAWRMSEYLAEEMRQGNV